jgi:ABC-2 type transport system ATP-binding protein
MEEADQLCDRVAIVDHGKIIALDTPDSLKKSLQQTGIVELKVSNFQQEDGRELEAMSGVEKAVVAFSDPVVGEATIKIHAEEAEEVIPTTTEFLMRHGARIIALEQTKPTLEDVFISMTGRKLRD